MSRMEIFVGKWKIAELDTADLKVSVRPKDGDKPCYEVNEKPVIYAAGKASLGTAHLQGKHLQSTEMGTWQACGCETMTGRYTKVCHGHRQVYGYSPGDPVGIVR